MSYTDQDLDDAVAAGVLPRKHADGFRHFIETSRRSLTSAEENFRLLTGFSDIFVGIACVLVLVSIWLLGNLADSALGHGLNIVVAWGLAEYFTRVRRMALPSIILLIAFVISGFYTIFNILSDDPLAAWLPLLAAAGLAWLHWIRFRVPITVAAGVAALIVIILAVIAVIAEPIVTSSDRLAAKTSVFGTLNLNPDVLIGALMMMGVATLALAIWWDSRNIYRTTRQADVAFWLHILASLIIVHTLFSEILLNEDFTSAELVAITLGIYGLLCIISIILDRRTLMVSSLGYAVFAAEQVTTDNIDSLGFALAGLIIGGGLLMLSALWQSVRRVFMKLSALWQSVRRVFMKLSALWQSVRRVFMKPLPLAITNRLPPA